MNPIKPVFIPTLPTQIMNLEMFAAFGPVAYAIPSDAVRAPFLPVARFLDDAFAIVGNAREQVKMLTSFGVTNDHVEVLEHRVAGLKAVHNLWLKERVAGLSSSIETAVIEGEMVRHEVIGLCRATLAKHAQFNSRLGALELHDGVDGILTDLSLLQGLMVDAKNVFGSYQIDVAPLMKKLTGCLEILEKGCKDFVVTDSMMQTLELRNRMYTLALDSIFGVTDAAWAAFGLDRSVTTNKVQWSSYAAMADYGWSL